MDLRLIATTFTTLFLAELGDKTQLAVLSLTASSKQPWAVFIGAMGALALVTAMGVLIGQGLTRVVPAWLLQKLAAAAFLIIGAVMLVQKSG